MSLFCEICTELIGPTEDVRTTTCGHLFHFNCVSEWYSRGHRTCPHCRQASSSLNLQKIFLTCVTEDQVHLNKNCPSAKLEEELYLSKASLKTLKDDLDGKIADNQEMVLKLLSMEEFHTRTMDEVKDKFKELELKVSLAVIENEGKDERLKQYEEKITFLEESLKNSKIEDDTQNEILLLKLILEEKEKLLIKANEDIKKLELLQEIKEKTAIFKNSDSRRRPSHEKSSHNGKNCKILTKSSDSEKNRIVKSNDKVEDTVCTNNKKTKGENVCEIPEQLVEAILSKWEKEKIIKKLSSKSDKRES
ncbi:E3 ubiquitin-protein ligase TRAIP-like [Condylostylus longicornis]|uniref:E3 ubiquitin-protein ligase TRAIP-like n=1 Tax=Condylostylus longicornis TaxID=2530218 RepID=UPI00244E1358|nr:E3 ubiquitin-protein ligase TRAIP-like [Condylostylus longicornis]